MQIRTGKKTEIWLALAIALGLQAIVLLLPINWLAPQPERAGTQIEVQFGAFSQQLPVPQMPAPRAETEPEPEAKPEPVTPVLIPTPVSESEAETPRLTSSSQVRDPGRDLDAISEQEKRRLTNTILARQFITEESAADRIFGKPIESAHSGPVAEFHYPIRQNMLAMLDEPMPAIPFAYTPGLINFAYDPGVAGDLQRFWDKITPEFGWATKNGTEFKCVWVLVVVGCGWK